MEKNDYYLFKIRGNKTKEAAHDELLIDYEIMRRRDLYQWRKHH